ncbi:hypothetical protein [Glutamicibacter arilaitensis]|uniref:hypothetical protein n=1 Tax=Glutamicibacter arilaitensis TaxID=256701 RepID=UPI003F90802C
MSRTRNIKPWKRPNFAFNSLGEFTDAPRTDGLLTIRHNRDYLDFLVTDNKSDTTLVVFSGALSANAKYTPAFSGIKLAADTGVNLISVADPTMAKGEITVAWYLGNAHIGPIANILGSAIQHIIESLGSKNTIIFGGSGGGYAAARMAYDFPECTAFIFNPRLNLDQWSKGPLTRYFRNALDKQYKPNAPDENFEILRDYGPIQISELSKNPRNHDLLIYQNILDPNFIDLQLLPFMRAVTDDDRVLYRFSTDELGHTPIPAQKVRSIISALAGQGSKKKLYSNAGFVSREDSPTMLLDAISAHARQQLAKEV